MKSRIAARVNEISDSLKIRLDGIAENPVPMFGCFDHAPHARTVEDESRICDAADVT